HTELQILIYLQFCADTQRVDFQPLR
ncbi:uncharacterized protein METZ01_LOCUS273492, partial [marine metagenome]